MHPRVTMRDVAQAAGVSPATASRALAGHPTVSPDLASRVLEAGKRLGYSPNAVARALRTRHTGTVGVVVPAISNPYFIGVVEALERVLAETDRSLILCDARENAASEASRIQFLTNRMVDGLVVVPVSSSRSGDALREAVARMPVVQFDRHVKSTGTDFVGSDNAKGVRQMVDHVHQRGCSQLTYVGAEPTISSAAERLRAFRTLVANNPRSQQGAALLGDFSIEWGMEAGRRLLATGRVPEAVICGADVIAVGLLSVLREAGVSVPNEVKVVSYDDLALGRLTTPTLSSVRQPVDTMAREAVRLLDDRSQPDPPPERCSIFAPKLIVRESTARGKADVPTCGGAPSLPFHRRPGNGTTP